MHHRRARQLLDIVHQPICSQASPRFVTEGNCAHHIGMMARRDRQIVSHPIMKKIEAPRHRLCRAYRAGGVGIARAGGNKEIVDRATKDIDGICLTSSYSQHGQLQDELRTLGFSEAMAS